MLISFKKYICLDGEITSKHKRIGRGKFITFDSQIKHWHSFCLLLPPPLLLPFPIQVNKLKDVQTRIINLQNCNIQMFKF